MRLFALTVKGDLDGMIDVVSAREDWTQVVALSKRLRNSKWVYRAAGQLGFCDYYQGDLASTRRRVGMALTSATRANDVGAEVFFLSTLALGLSYQNMPEASAFQYVQQALNVAKAHPDV